MVRGQADVAVAALDQTYDRAKVVGFPIGISLYRCVAGRLSVIRLVNLEEIIPTLAFILNSFLL